VDLLKAYHAIAGDKAFELPVMRSGGLSENLETLAEPEQVTARLTGLAPTQGWLLFQSWQGPFHDGLPQFDPAWGLLLACEAVTAEGVSLALDQDGLGGWRLLCATHQETGDCLVDELQLLAHTPATGNLCYRRYWRRQPGQGYVQAAACFIGFE
jgi:hypothetical protein